MSESLPARVTQTALLSAGRQREVRNDLLATDLRSFAPMDPLTIPSGEGWVLSDTVAATLKVHLRATPGRRQLWLVIDSSQSISGTLSIVTSEGTATHVASGETGDVLMDAWLAAFASDLDGVAVVQAVAFGPSGQRNALRLDFDDPDVEVTSATGPAGAQMQLYREPEAATGVVFWGKSTPTGAGGRSRSSASSRLQAVAWSVMRTWGALTVRGLRDPTLDLAGAGAAWVQVEGLSYPEAAPGTTTSGSGLYGLHPALLVEIEQAVR